MNKSLALMPVVFAILALIVSPAMMSAYAAQPENKPDACEERNPGVSKAVGNKHCGDIDPPTEGKDCTYGIDGNITAEELFNSGIAVFPDVDYAQNIIDTEEAQVGGADNGIIDNDRELKELNEILLISYGKICY